MLFSSTVFLYIFLPIVIFFYYIVFRKSRLLQNIFLLFASLFFYAWGEPKFVLLMIASIIVNWFFGLMVAKTSKQKALSKLMIVIDVSFNLSMLFVFKYLAFSEEILNKLFGLNMTISTIALPIGISFFTFQAMSYVIDVYRQKAIAQNNIFYVGLYISFFPQLIAGPIVRYETVANQIVNRKETWDDLFDGFARFIVGLSKKVLLANSFSIIADQAFNTSNEVVSLSVTFSWLGAIAYTLQIFFDFSGYSDMAIGLGRMFGFHFLENFNYPYIATSISEFWRRWHISLGSWFRDYLYFPLGGSRCGKARNVLNLFIVWVLTGLWHGANYTFIVWGLMQFVLLVFEKYIGLSKKNGVIISVLKRIYTVIFIILGMTVFRASSVRSAVVYIKTMFGLNGTAFIDGMFTGWFVQNFFLLVIGVVLCTPLLKILGDRVKNSTIAGFAKAGALSCLFVLSVSNLISSSYNPFIYFNF